MLFYLYHDVPIDGDDGNDDTVVALDKVEDLILKRFNVYCLFDTSESRTDDINRYQDGIAHLFMCIVAIDFPCFKKSFYKGELKIFRERLKVIDCEDLKNELSTVLAYLDNLAQSEDINKLKPKRSKHFTLVRNTIEVLVMKTSHAFRKTHSEQCKKLKLTIPFTFPLKLVASRQVEVHNGKVSMSCGKWNTVLELIFEYLLKLELNLMEKCEALKKVIYESEDDRIRQVIVRFVRYLNGNLKTNEQAIKAEDLDVDSKYFPPCMANLHQILRRTHRLSYESRYQYSLFLKDIGLPVDESISFWEDEYRKPHEGSCCTHDWEEKEKRYKYQIQHLYGLIGTHGLKTSHSCDKFIQEVQAKMDGGCPFQHMSTEELKKVIPKNLTAVPEVEDILSYCSSDMPQKACAIYLQCQRKVSNRRISAPNVPYIVSPVQYYLLAKNLSRDC